MATDTKKGLDPAAQEGAAQGAARGAREGAAEGARRGAAQSAVSRDAILTTPIYFKRDRPKKKGKRNRRKKYSRGSKGLQRLIFGFTKAAYRTTNAVARGLNTFAKRSNRSARKRRDGLIRDSLRNVSRGFNSGTRELGKAPDEIARRIGTGNVRRVFRTVTFA